MEIVWIDHGTVAWFAPESDYDRELLKKAKEGLWSEEKILDEVIAARRAGLSR